ncbi:hypothetical protein ABIA00_003584 [Bradyrhizobium ottawaense]
MSDGSTNRGYNRINGSSYFQFSRLDETDEEKEADSFEDAFANMRLTATSSSGRSSSTSRSYWLSSIPPMVEISRSSFRQAAKDYESAEIKCIADNPQEYSKFVSARAERTAELASDYGTTRDSDNARYFSYQLGSKSVGLGMEGGRQHDELRRSKSGRSCFPGDLGLLPLWIFRSFIRLSRTPAIFCSSTNLEWFSTQRSQASG